MLFSSDTFLFGFLPATLAAVAILGWVGGRRAVLLGLLAASCLFYAWWNPPYLALLVASVSVNYGLGVLLLRRRSGAVLALGVAFNLGLIAYFKYAQFLLDNANQLLGSQWSAGQIVLPLAISFFTFQQVAYLVDVYQGKVRDSSFLHYGLFVSFFPQLIAGPIIHHSEVIPQFTGERNFRLRWPDLWVGLTIFAIGLYKKVVIADGVAVYANAVFAGAGAHPTLIDAWCGALAYTFQIYFDFSGYSDMAIGLARMFGVQLPLNFHSPYKAVNIIDFWRRWHMTLSRFLRDYLYFPLGGNRKGRPRRYLNLMLTMLLGGLWHGAAWNFIVWGGIHGAFLVINHAWHAAKRALGVERLSAGPWGTAAARLLTFLAVVASWVVFRADSFNGALAMLAGMAGLNGVVLASEWAAALGGAPFGIPVGDTLLSDPGCVLWLGLLLLIVWVAPNTQEWMADCEPVIQGVDRCLPESLVAARGRGGLWGQRLALVLPYAAVTGLIAGLIVAYRGAATVDFIYMIF